MVSSCPSALAVFADTIRLSPLARVLIIDDDVNALRIWEESLRDTCRAFFSANGQDGLRMAMEINPDLVILNQITQDLPGHEVVTRLRAADKRGQMRIVLRGAIGGIVDAQTGRLIGADLCIPKTIDIAVAVFKIRSLLKRPYVPQDACRRLSDDR